MKPVRGAERGTRRKQRRRGRTPPPRPPEEASLQCVSSVPFEDRGRSGARQRAWPALALDRSRANSFRASSGVKDSTESSARSCRRAPRSSEVTPSARSGSGGDVVRAAPSARSTGRYEDGRLKKRTGPTRANFLPRRPSIRCRGGPAWHHIHALRLNVILPRGFATRSGTSFSKLAVAR